MDEKKREEIIIAMREWVRDSSNDVVFKKNAYENKIIDLAEKATAEEIDKILDSEVYDDPRILAERNGAEVWSSIKTKLKKKYGVGVG
jgi:hypothetical protein